MALVVGLGNPGAEYAGTRHNAGFRVLESLVRRLKATVSEHRAEYLSWSAGPHDRRVTLLQPLTWMNLSGEAVAAWRDTHGLETSELLVVTDDVYLPVGHIRLRAHGSSGGHRGLESIERSLGTREFARLRIGVGSVESSELREHVLRAPLEDERAALERAVGEASLGVESWLEQGVIVAMNRINRKVPKEVSES